MIAPQHGHAEKPTWHCGEAETLMRLVARSGYIREKKNSSVSSTEKGTGLTLRRETLSYSDEPKGPLLLLLILLLFSFCSLSVFVPKNLCP